MKRLFLVAGLLAISTSAMAQRHVWVNGQRMNPAQIGALDRASCRVVPNGRYWLARNGIWGYANNPRPQGHIADNCRRNARGAAGGRQMLDRGPFGTYLSDGNCSFVNGVPVGRC